MATQHHVSLQKRIKVVYAHVDEILARVRESVDPVCIHLRPKFENVWETARCLYEQFIGPPPTPSEATLMDREFVLEASIDAVLELTSVAKRMDHYQHAKWSDELYNCQLYLQECRMYAKEQWNNEIIANADEVSNADAKQHPRYHIDQLYD